MQRLRKIIYPQPLSTLKIGENLETKDIHKLKIAIDNVYTLSSERKNIELEGGLSRVNGDVIGLCEVRRKGESLGRSLL